MTTPLAIRKIGQVTDAGGAAFSVGVDHDLITIWPGKTQHAPADRAMRRTIGQLAMLAILLHAASDEVMKARHASSAPGPEGG